IEGRELHVSVLGNDPPIVLPVIEQDFSELPSDHPRILTYNIKWNPLVPEFHQIVARCPAELPPDVEQRVSSLALQAYAATSCRDYARVDFRLGGANAPYVLEVSPNPTLTPGASFRGSAEKAGFAFSETLGQIVEMALVRHAKRTPPPAWEDDITLPNPPRG
ncbi:MAG: hypothetical protein GY953_40915, partial [bacterium]|nr:hypothetical protein [bacterium]